ncbi:uncharacterized protein LOC135835005 [Planococcus citri]|uniref:uncharacterized protein LOC135835005 n=1 Tax=Planococcus citri TaxID=170843 RepID=UPI0031F86ED8
MGKKPKQNKWKVVDPGGVTGTFPDLISIEELVDYKAIRGKDQYSDPVVDDVSSTKKKRKKKKKPVTSGEPKSSEQTENTPALSKVKSKRKTPPDDEEPSVDAKKRKKKKKPVTSGKSKSSEQTQDAPTLSKAQSKTETSPDNKEPSVDAKKRKKKKQAASKKRKLTDQSESPANKKMKPNVETAPDDEEANVDTNDTDMSAWMEFNLADQIIKALAAKKFSTPTEIQSLTLPEAIVRKKDVLGAAETGSGKTLAFGIPIVNAILEARANQSEKDDKLWALIVTPTRELTIQVKNHLSDLCKFTDIKVLEIVGGLSIEKQDRKLSEKPEIVVGTPGRLWELIRSENEHLLKVDHVKFFVIDEADRMLEKFHFAEFTNLLERMNLNSKKSDRRQTLVFSATLSLTHAPPSYVYNKKKKGKMKNDQMKMTPEQKLKSFVKSLNLKNPAIIDITQKHVLPSRISESCIQCPADEKDYYLHYLLKMHTGRKIVFSNSINCVRRLHRLLNVLQCNAKILFADIAQNQRLKNLENFQKDPNGLLLATDVAARGLDIPNVEYIIHYEVPKASEIYVHRSGRSVRGLTAEGTSILFVSPSENYHFEKIRNTLGKTEKIPSYKMAIPEVFAASKRLVNLGRKIEQLESKMKTVQSNANWVEKCAKEMDILLDDEDMPEKLDDREKKTQKLTIKRLKAELKQLMSKPIVPLQESMRYPSFSTVQSYLKINANV